MKWPINWLVAFAVVSTLCIALALFVDVPLARSLVGIRFFIPRWADVGTEPILVTGATVVLLYAVSFLYGHPLSDAGTAAILSSCVVFGTLTINDFILKPLFGRLTVDQYFAKGVASSFILFMATIRQAFRLGMK